MILIRPLPHQQSFFMVLEFTRSHNDRYKYTKKAMLKTDNVLIKIFLIIFGVIFCCQTFFGEKVRFSFCESF